MDTTNVYPAEAEKLGFSVSKIIPAGMLECSDKIRALCAPDKCGHYGTSWVCPPGCGSIEECTSAISGYENAMLLQSIYENADISSEEGLMKLTKEHNGRTKELLGIIRRKYPEAYMLSTGGCDLCEKCSIPEPCRIPDKKRGSLSAFGIDVGALCEKAGIEYTFVPEILRLVSCILF